MQWRRLPNEELHELYSSSPNTIWVIKSRRMRWTEHVARMGDRRGAFRVLVGDPRERNHKYVGVDVRIILIWISKKWDVGHGLD
jgi:hypothetical protein